MGVPAELGVHRNAGQGASDIDHAAKRHSLASKGGLGMVMVLEVAPCGMRADTNPPYWRPRVRRAAFRKEVLDGEAR